MMIGLNSLRCCRGAVCLLLWSGEQANTAPSLWKGSKVLAAAGSAGANLAGKLPAAAAGSMPLNCRLKQFTA